MLKTMNHGGRIALLGIPPSDMGIDWNQVIFKGLVIKGIYGREMFETWYKMASLIQSGLDLTPIITHHYKIDDFQAGFDVMRSGMSGKVILVVCNKSDKHCLSDLLFHAYITSLNSYTTCPKLSWPYLSPGNSDNRGVKEYQVLLNGLLQLEIITGPQ
ncbi:L-threonine 3-dehydrogenase [Photobacterium aphoticum]|uniref:L-threonine 3-dehydrogenase n=1 Tax=Photobacterium aphoticum TaxID=754436 RepID=A0A090QNK9_9GAMM|nr:L-threonine 3-dehydrogenase [Photobacterium aphoticum]